MLAFRVSTLALRSMSAALQGAGLDRDALLAAAGIAPETVEEADRYVFAPTVFRLWRAARSLDPSPDLGLRAGAAIPAGALEVLDYLGSTSANVRDALDQTSRYFTVVATNMLRWEMHGDDSPQPELRFRTLLPSAVLPPILRDYAFSALAARVRDWSGGVVPVRVELTGRGLVAEAAYAETFRCKVLLRGRHNRVVFDPEDLRRELPRRDPALAVVLRRHASHLAESAPEPDFQALVRREVATELRAAEPSMATVARRLGVSHRTLQRRLTDSGTTWSELVDDTRRQIALECLKERTMSIGEIGLLLGYSEPSAFTRAFRRWMNTTPSAYRTHETSSPAEPLSRRRA